MNATNEIPGRFTRPAIRAASFWVLVLFLSAILVALVITLWSVPPAAKVVSVVAVVPIVALVLLALSLERSDKRWGYAGAGVLGGVGVALRLVVSTQPALEVGGGLPIEVTAAYIALGATVVATSFASYFSFSRP